MRSVCQVLLKQERLQVASEGGTVEIRVSQFIRHVFQVAGAATAKARRPYVFSWNLGATSKTSYGWLNGDAVVQRLERPACTAQTSSQVHQTLN